MCTLPDGKYFSLRKCSITRYRCNRQFQICFDFCQSIILDTKLTVLEFITITSKSECAFAISGLGLDLMFAITA